MQFDLSTATDFFSALALLSFLALSYGWLRSVMARVHHAQILLGLLFGLVTVLQMQLPLRPMPGVVIDLRAIPIVLAGAFLGWRGAVLAMAIAMASRLSIGGVGTAAGCAGIVLSGTTGLGWARAMRDRPNRTIGSAIWLGALTSANALSLLFLPAASALWVLLHVMPFLSLTYLVVIPVFAVLIEREGASVWAVRQLWASASTDAATGLLTMDALARAAAQRAEADGPTEGTGLAVFSLRHEEWIRRTHGESALDTIRAALRVRLEERLARCDVLARTPSGSIAAFLPDRDAEAVETLATLLAQELSRRPLRLADGGMLRVSLDLGHAWTVSRRPLSELMTEASAALAVNAQAGGVDATAAGARRRGAAA